MPHAEYERRREVDTSLLAAFQATFMPRTDLYPVQQADGKYHTIHHPLLSHHLLDHLSGKLTLGAYALNTASLANWIVLDADTQAYWTGLLALADGLAQHGITAYREPSRRGGHLWLFTLPLPGMFARRFANQLLHEHHLEGVEVYPKQDQLVTGCGSLVRLPFGVHRLTGKVYSFIQSDGQPLAPTIRDQMRLLASPARLPLPFFVSVLARVPVTPPQPKSTPIFQPAVDIRTMPLSETPYSTKPTQRCLYLMPTHQEAITMVAKVILPGC
jgi:hypothetical protein